MSLRLNPQPLHTANPLEKPEIKQTLLGGKAYSL